MISLCKICAVVLCWIGSAAFADLPQIERALHSNPTRAYELGLKIRDHYEGEPQFDFVFALAAIESGNAEEAIFPLERLLMSEPHNALIRLTLARAQYIVGDYTSSKDNFKQVLSRNPPPQVRQNIENFLSAIEYREHQAKIIRRIYVGSDFGVDSNINRITSGDNTFTGVGVVPLSEDTRKRTDGFTELSALGSIVYPLDKYQSFYGSASFKDRFHGAQRKWDNSGLNFTGGLQLRRGVHTLRLPVQLDYMSLARHSLSKRRGLGVEWTRDLKNGNENTLFLQTSLLNYPHEMVQDTSGYSIGSIWAHQTQSMPLQLIGTIFYGQDQAKLPTGNHNTKVSLGGLGNARWNFTAKQSAGFELGLQRSGFAGVHPLFSKRRHDVVRTVGASWNCQASPKLVFNAKIQYTRSFANIDIYDYNRIFVSAGFRYLL